MHSECTKKNKLWNHFVNKITITILRQFKKTIFCQACLLNLFSPSNICFCFEHICYFRKPTKTNYANVVFVYLTIYCPSKDPSKDKSLKWDQNGDSETICFFLIKVNAYCYIHFSFSIIHWCILVNIGQIICFNRWD